MKQIPLCDWLPKLARWSDTAPARDYPSRSHNNISLKSKRVHVVFFHEIFSVTCKNIFCDFLLEIEVENEKIEMHHHFCM